MRKSVKFLKAHAVAALVLLVLSQHNLFAEKRTVEIPEEAKKAFDSAIMLTASDFEYELTDDGKGVRLTNYTGLETAIKIPAEIEGMPVTEIKWIFDSSGKEMLDALGMPAKLSSGKQLYEPILETVVIPNSVKKIIMDYASSRVRNKLKYVKLSESISELSNDLFSECKKLEYIYIPDSVVSIGDNAFANTALKSIDVPDGVSLGRGVFRECSNLEKFILPKNIKEIPESFFNGCKSLHNIDIPESVTSIGERAFFDTGLEKINFPKKLSTIGSGAFASCENLEEIIVPDSVTVIGNGAFSNSGIKKLVLSDNVTNVTEIGYYGTLVWAGCSFLEEVHLSNKMTFLPEEMGESSSIKVMNFPASLKYSHVRSFPASLENIIIPDSLTAVSFFENCFSKTKLPLLTQKRLRELGYKDSFAGTRTLK